MFNPEILTDNQTIQTDIEALMQAYKKRKFDQNLIYNAFSQQRSLTPTKRMDTVFNNGTATSYTPDLVNCQTLPIVQATNVIQALNLVTTGNAQSQRNGNKIIMEKLDFNFWCQNGPNTNPNGMDMVRFLIVYDNATNGAYPTTYGGANSILSSQLTTGVIDTTFNITANKDTSNYDRFSILYDTQNRLPMDGAIGVAGNNGFVGPLDQQTMVIKGSVKLGDLGACYNTLTTGLISSITVGGLYVVVLGLQLGSTNAIAWSLEGTTRLHYRE